MYAQAAQGYRAASLAGLSDAGMLKKGLHGVVVHFQRAVAVSDEERACRATHLAKADQLLNFLGRIADKENELGRALTQAYTKLQYLVSVALAGNTEAATEVIESALLQARELETTISHKIGGQA